MIRGALGFVCACLFFYGLMWIALQVSLSIQGKSRLAEMEACRANPSCFAIGDLAPGETAVIPIQMDSANHWVKVGSEWIALSDLMEPSQ